MQNTIIKLKKSLESFKSRHGHVEARISDLQGKTWEITSQRSKKKKKKEMTERRKLTGIR